MGIEGTEDRALNLKREENVCTQPYKEKPID